MLFAIAYPIVGIALSFPANAAANNVRLAWRLGVWLICAAVFLTHIALESRARNTPLPAAWHAAVAVAIGGFLLAVWVNVHGQWMTSRPPNPLAPWALVLFPLVTGVPAFVAGFVAASVLARIRPPGATTVP